MFQAFVNYLIVCESDIDYFVKVKRTYSVQLKLKL